jgi:hypothetical protein
MGFEEDARLIESTSFKSKFVDYLLSGRPIVGWGPDYCTAVRHARKHDFAECITDSNPEILKNCILELSNNPKRCTELVDNALRFFQKEIDSDVVFKMAYDEKCKLISRSVPL